ncbi:hypothetical protein INQ41_00255 [Lysobacter ciconiae]|uniref:Uncharacterized protein n=1 Tax=Novilysobacter ciconiae TaxID=2781022 RepID=A0A7S6ZSL6_9GAMM|nr:hypothetical protein [Lysobacter ciconiae]QOW19574.1 hypothetical protein INQ41_00255 [Lysobacter ciconiae]
MNKIRTLATRTAPQSAATNSQPNSLVKVIVTTDKGKWVSPTAQKVYFISEDAVFPTIQFEIETDAAGPYKWSWQLIWEARQRTRETGARKEKTIRTLSESGKHASEDKKWIANLGEKVVGGKLTVKVDAGSQSFERSVHIRGKNPGAERVLSYLKEISDVAGFDKIIDKESSFKNFIEADGEPLLSFDGGYGLTQMTNPAPDFEQMWNWKENIKGGCSLYQEKQRAAKSFLGKNSRSYTSKQLELETWSRWNGGGYHRWDEAMGKWERNEDILCDSKTGNIGWDITHTENEGKTAAELRTRDANPKRDKAAANKWKYTGICYADHLDED